MQSTPLSGRRKSLGIVSAALLLFAVALAALPSGAGSTSAPQAGGASPGLTDTTASPHVVLRSIGLQDVRWRQGFWADRFETCRTNMLPTLGRIMEGSERSQFLHNFRIAAGLSEGGHRGPDWNDGDCYKWLEAAAAVFALTKDAALDRQMDEAIAVIARAQRDDGYLHTPVLIRQRAGDAGARPFADRLDFEMYNLGHLMTTACVHFRATGKDNLLKVAIKAADFLDAAFQSPSPELARSAVCPAHYMGIVELYRTTREPRYLALAVKLLDLRDDVDGGGDDNQDRIPFRLQREAVGHAVRANYLYAGAADVYAETGDPSLLAPLQAIWEDVVSKKMYVTGACGALYDGASPDGTKDQEEITRIHQAYGRAYQLPNSTAHNESCASVGNVLWNWRMLQITGEARFADVLEIALYNAVLASISLDGERYFYTNTLRQLDQMPVELRWSRSREPFIKCFCCPPNVIRTIAEVGSYAYSRSEGAVWVHLYGANRLSTTLPAGGPLRLTQETDYPWDGHVRITIDAAPAEPLALRLRIPGWASGAALKVNGEALEAPAPGAYAEIRRAWTAGDVVELDLPLRVRLLEAHPLAEELRGQVAVQRGPLVYCLESTDLPEGVRISDVELPRTAELQPRFDGALLGGVCVLEGEAEAAAAPAWEKQLYRPLAEANSKRFPVRFIPYYAWQNRGGSEMTVWLPLGR